MKTLTHLHNCNSGDLICALPGIRESYRKSGKKAIICQVLDMPGHYMAGLVHSVKSDQGIQVTFNQKMFEMMRPLLLSQEYVEDFQIFKDQKIDIDHTIIRESEIVENLSDALPKAIIKPKLFVNIPHMALPGWIMLAYPHLACDISEPWILLADESAQNPAAGSILINRTERYQAPDISYSFLKQYETELLFVGTETEHIKFCRQFKLNFPRLQVDNFLELAHAFKSCRFFLGNQSFPWNLANAMGVSRILEMCTDAPNCQPFIGKDSYGFLYEDHLEYYFKLLHKKTGPSHEAA